MGRCVTIVLTGLLAAGCAEPDVVITVVNDVKEDVVLYACADRCIVACAAFCHDPDDAKDPCQAKAEIPADTSQTIAVSLDPPTSPFHLNLGSDPRDRIDCWNDPMGVTINVDIAAAEFKAHPPALSVTLGCHVPAAGPLVVLDCPDGACEIVAEDTTGQCLN